MQSFELCRCACGKTHKPLDLKVFCERGAIERLPEALDLLGIKRPFLLADQNTFSVAGARAVQILQDREISHSLYVFEESPAPDDRAVGTAVMHLDRQCDGIVGIGSGVINDICKVLSVTAGIPMVIVATAPSMDGYASASSSMELHGLKISLPTKFAEVIIGDLDILANSPLKLRLSGLGDMAAKYISICEWQLSHLITGEYYCDRVAATVKRALDACMKNAEGLVRGDAEAMRAVFEGLILVGAEMTYSETTRPASGVEHYISHVWDMRALEFGTPHSTHGLQCATGTVIASAVYDRLKAITPDRDKAIAAFDKFRYEDYKPRLRALLGKAAEAMIKLEDTEKKYDREKFLARLDRILSHWNEILGIIDRELMAHETLLSTLKSIGVATTPRELGIDGDNLGEVFEATRDIRDKYTVSRLVFDLGLNEEIKGFLKNSIF